VAASALIFSAAATAALCSATAFAAAASSFSCTAFAFASSMAFKAAAEAS